MKHILLLISILCIALTVNAQQPSVSRSDRGNLDNSQIDIGKVDSKPITDHFSVVNSPFINKSSVKQGDIKSNFSECLISIGGHDLYHFTLNDPSNPVSYGTSSPDFLNCAEYVDGIYYATSASIGELFQIDPTSGAISLMKSGFHSCAIAYNVMNETMYGLSTDINANAYSIDLTDGSETLIGTFSYQRIFICMTIDNNGRCFAVDILRDCVCELDLNNCYVKSHQLVGFDLNYGQDITCDRETNDIFWFTFNSDIYKTQFYKVDFDKHDYSLINNLSGQLTCFASKTEYYPNRPSAPDNFIATPNSGLDLTCDLTWTNPFTSVNGESLPKIDEIILKRNDSVIYSIDNATPGESMIFHDEVTEGGDYDYYVNAVYNGISGQPAHVSAHIGHSVIDVNPTSIVKEVYSMHNDTAKIIITNSGSDKLKYHIKYSTNCKVEEPLAYCAIGGQNIYSFSLDNPSVLNQLGVIAPEFLNSMCYVEGDAYYFATFTSGYFGTFDPETGAFTTIKTGNKSGSIAYNPQNGNLYGISLGSEPIIYLIDPKTGDETPILSVNRFIYALSIEFNNDGRCFVVAATILGMSVGGICEVNMTTGDYTLLVHQFSVSYGQDLDCNRETNTLYWAAFNETVNQGQLWTVDVNNNNMTQIGTFPNQASGFAIQSNQKWLSINKHFGTVNPGEIDTCTLVFGGWYADYGTYTGNIAINNNSLTPIVNVPLTFTIDEPLCSAPTNLTIDVVNFNNMHLSWTTPENSDGLSYYGIYNNDERTPFATVDPSETFFDCVNLPDGNYCYKVRAFYSDGCVSLSPQQVCAEATGPYGVVTGKVISSLTNYPISNATVTFTGDTTLFTTSDANGDYSLNAFIGTYGFATYSVIASASGFINDTLSNITVTIDPYTNLNMLLDQPLIDESPDSVSVSVVSMHDGQAQISITNNGNGQLKYHAKTSIIEDESPISYIVINGTDIYSFHIDDPSNITFTGYTAPFTILSICYVNGVYYCLTNTNRICVFDSETGAFPIILNLSDHVIGICSSITYNPQDGMLYYVDNDEFMERTYFQSINLQTNDIISKGSLDNVLIKGFAFDNGGHWFVVDDFSDAILEIDNKYMPEIINTIPLGFAINGYQDLDCDRLTNTIYLAGYNATAKQYQLNLVDVDNNSITQIATYNQQTSGFVIPSSIGWLTAQLPDGTVDAGQTDTLTLNMDGNYADQGTYYGTCRIVNNTVNPNIDIPVTFTINPSICASVNDPSLDVEYNTIHLSWSIPSDIEDIVGYYIYRNNNKTPIAYLSPSETIYTDDNLVPGHYCYRIGALYSDSCIALSEKVCGNSIVQCGHVTGTVTDSLTGQPIENATIKFGTSAIATTDASGHYGVNVPVDTYHNVSIQADNYSTLYIKTCNVVLSDNPLDIYLNKIFNSVMNITSQTNRDTVSLSWNKPKEYEKSYELNEGFEDYVIDMPIIEQTDYPWVNITGYGCDVSDIHAASGNNSLYIYGTRDDRTDCMLGEKNSGHYILSFYIFLEEDKYALIDLLNDSNIGYLSEACEIWIDDEDAMVRINHQWIVFPFSYNTWTPFVFDIDLNKDIASLSINNQFITNWEYSNTFGGGTIKNISCLRLNAVDLKKDSNSFQEFFIDDIKFEDISANPVNVTDAIGYNITRDNNLIGTWTDTTYTEYGLQNGIYNYCVTAQYYNGESNPVCVNAVVNYTVKGDANGDGYVDISDIQSVIAFILNQNPTPWNFENADVNSDGNVNMADIQGIVNIILGMKSETCSNSYATVTYMIQNGILYINTPVELSAFQIGFNSSDIEALGVFDGFETVESWDKTNDKFYLLSYNMNNFSLQPGTYALMKVGGAELKDFVLSDPNGCVVNTKQDNILGIEDVSLDYAQPYPNPFTGTVTIPYTVSKANDNISVKVTNVCGHIIYETNMSNLSVGKHVIEWTPQNVAHGVYFVTVQINGQDCKKSKLIYEK